jgi:hypothetical protein
MEFKSVDVLTSSLGVWLNAMRMTYLIPCSRIFVAAVLTFCSACAQSTKVTQEYINPPVSLSITNVAAQTYELSFFSDNREGGFAGYGIFTGATAADLAAYPASAIESAALFCVSTSQSNYKTVVTIQVGPAAASATLCNLTGLTLTVGQFVAVRARVERLENPWSQVAVVQVP